MILSADHTNFEFCLYTRVAERSMPLETYVNISQEKFIY